MPIIVVYNKTLMEDELRILIAELAGPVAEILTCSELNLTADEVMIDVNQLSPLGVMHRDAIIEIKASTCDYRLSGGDDHAQLIGSRLKRQINDDLPPDRERRSIGIWIRLASGGYADVLI